jgi:hypothetical protein
MKNYNFTFTQDWHNYFLKVFETKKIKNLLEFGLGDGTEFLLDYCEFVKSVELSLGDFNLNWFDQTRKKLGSYTNWECAYQEVSEVIKKADMTAQASLYPLADLQYLDSLKSIIKPHLDEKKWDFIFIDAGIHTRGDIVNFCFGKADIIAAHDTSRNPANVIQNIYGYNIVKVPENYQEVYFDCTYLGTTFWIKNTEKELLEVLSKFKLK